VALRKRRVDEVEVKVKLHLVAAKRITMLDLRRRAEAIVRAVQGGQRMVLTYRGRPVMRLEPVEPAPAPSDDDFYKLPELADRRPGTSSGPTASVSRKPQRSLRSTTTRLGRSRTV